MSLFAKIFDITADDQVLVTIQGEIYGEYELIEETDIDNERVMMTTTYNNYRDALIAFNRYAIEDAMTFFFIDAPTIPYVDDQENDID